MWSVTIVTRATSTKVYTNEGTVRETKRNEQRIMKLQTNVANSTIEDDDVCLATNENFI